MDAVKRKLALMMFEMLIARLTAENFKKMMAWLLDFARNYVIGTENKLDDKYALPILDAVEEAFLKDD